MSVKRFVTEFKNKHDQWSLAKWIFDHPHLTYIGLLTTCYFLSSAWVRTCGVVAMVALLFFRSCISCDNFPSFSQKTYNEHQDASGKWRLYYNGRVPILEFAADCGPYDAGAQHGLIFGRQIMSMRRTFNFLVHTILRNPRPTAPKVSAFLERVATTLKNNPEYAKYWGELQGLTEGYNLWLNNNRLSWFAFSHPPATVNDFLYLQLVADARHIPELKFSLFASAACTTMGAMRGTAFPLPPSTGAMLAPYPPESSATSSSSDLSSPPLAGGYGTDTAPADTPPIMGRNMDWLPFGNAGTNTIIIVWKSCKNGKDRRDSKDGKDEEQPGEKKESEDDECEESKDEGTDNLLSKRGGVACITIPGLIGVVTGWNKDGLCLAENVCPDTGISITKRDGIPSILVNRRILESCSRVEDVRLKVEATSAPLLPLVPYHMTVCGGTDQRFMSVAFHQGTKSKHQGHLISHLESSEDHPVGNVGPQLRTLIVLNWKLPERKVGSFNSRDRQTLLDQYFLEASQIAHSTSTFYDSDFDSSFSSSYVPVSRDPQRPRSGIAKRGDMVALMNGALSLTPLVNSMITVHSVVFCPVSNRVHLNWNNGFSGEGAKHSLAMREIFTEF